MASAVSSGELDALRTNISKLANKVSSVVESARGGTEIDQLERDFHAHWEFSLTDAIQNMGFQNITKFLDQEMSDEVIVLPRRLAFEEVLGLKWPPSLEANRLNRKKRYKPEEFEKILEEWGNLDPDIEVVMCKRTEKTKHVWDLVKNQKPERLKNLGGKLSHGGSRPNARFNWGTGNGVNPFLAIAEAEKVKKDRPVEMPRAISPGPNKPMPFLLVIDVLEILEMESKPIPLDIQVKDNLLHLYEVFYVKEFPDCKIVFNCSLEALFKAHSTYFDVHQDVFHKYYTVSNVVDAPRPSSDEDVKMDAHQPAGLYNSDDVGYQIYQDFSSLSLEDLPGPSRGRRREHENGKNHAPTPFDPWEKVILNDLAEKPKTRIGDQNGKAIGSGMKPGPVRGGEERRVYVLDELDKPPPLHQKSIQVLSSRISEFEKRRRGNSDISYFTEIWTYMYFLLKSYAPHNAQPLSASVLKQLFHDHFNIVWDQYIVAASPVGENIKLECFLEAYQQHVFSRRNPIFDLEYRLREHELTLDRIRTLAFNDKKMTITKDTKRSVYLGILDAKDRLRKSQATYENPNASDDELEEEELLHEQIVHILPIPPQSELKLNNAGKKIAGTFSKLNLPKFDANYSAQIYSLLIEHFPYGIDVKGLAQGFNKKYSVIVGAPSDMEKYIRKYMQELITVTRPSRVHTWLAPRYDVRFEEGHQIPQEILVKTDMLEFYKREQERINRSVDDTPVYVENEMFEVYSPPRTETVVDVLDRRAIDECTKLVVNHILPLFPGGMETSSLVTLLHYSWEKTRDVMLPHLASPLTADQFVDLLDNQLNGVVDRQFFNTGTWIRNKENCLEEWSESTKQPIARFKPELMHVPVTANRTPVQVPKVQNPKPIPLNQIHFHNGQPETDNGIVTDTHTPHVDSNQATENADRSLVPNTLFLSRQLSQNQSMNNYLEGNVLRGADRMINRLGATIFKRLLDRVIRQASGRESEVLFSHMRSVFWDVLMGFVVENESVLNGLESEWNDLKFDDLEEHFMQYILDNPESFNIRFAGESETADDFAIIFLDRI